MPVPLSSRQLFHVSLKHGKFDTSDSAQLRMLDPFVSLLSESLSSPHSKVLCRALHCLVWVVRLPLPSLEEHVDPISLQLFAFLRRYARAGMAVGNNRELVTSSFKVREGRHVLLFPLPSPLPLQRK